MSSTAQGRGVFITVEGGEGAGKTTQIHTLAACLERAGIPVVTTREPGGTAGAEAIRALVLSGAVERWSGGVEALLMTAARLDHVERLIAPALAAGSWVLCDRFADSTRVYQGLAGSVGLDRIDALHTLFLDAARPDITILLDLPCEAGLARQAPERFLVVDATAAPAIVAERVEEGVRERLMHRLPAGGGDAGG